MQQLEKEGRAGWCGTSVHKTLVTAEVGPSTPVSAVPVDWAQAPLFSLMSLRYQQQEGSRADSFTVTTDICSWQPSFPGVSQPVPNTGHKHTCAHAGHCYCALTLWRKIGGHWEKWSTLSTGRAWKPGAKSLCCLGRFPTAAVFPRCSRYVQGVKRFTRSQHSTSFGGAWSQCMCPNQWHCVCIFRLVMGERKRFILVWRQLLWVK